MHRLITFLGIPKRSKKGSSGYESTAYRLLDPDGEARGEAVETPWIAVALAELFAPDEVVVVATREARDAKPEGANRANGDALREELEHRNVRVQFREIPTGLSQDQLWRQFVAVKEALRGDFKELTLDITHGLRSQPFFAAAATTFVGMVDRDRPRLHIVYGAHDLTRTLELDYAPIVDLSLFGEVLDWTHDLVLFLKSGRIAGLARRAEAIGRELRRRWALAGRQGEPPHVRELAEAVEAFARDLQTVRTGALLLGGVDRDRRTPSSAKRLREAVAAARADVERHLPPLADVLDRIEAMATRLDFDGDALVGERARDVLAALADLYLDMGRYVEAITLLREARITAFCPPAAACPGLPGFDEGERDFVERRIWFARERKRVETIANIRNDIDHAGFRRDPAAGVDLIEHIEDQRHAFDDLPFESRPHAGRLLVNITNHPWEEWPEDQRRAALELVERVEDMPFPEVGPDWGLRRIEREADALVDKLPSGTTHALVQGEFTLTMALVKRLQAKGIRCLAATTEREVERLPDGREARRYRFVRFRDYPQLH